MTTEYSYDSSGLISDQNGDDSQTESIDSHEILSDEAAIGLDIEIGSTSPHDDNSDDEISKCYDNMNPLSDTTSQDKTPDRMVPAQHKLIVTSSKASDPKNVLQMNKIMLKRKSEDTQPVVTMKSMKSINNNGSIQENTLQDSNGKTKKSTSIPVIKMSAHKFNSNKVFFKRGNDIDLNSIKVDQFNKVANSKICKKSKKVADFDTFSNKANTKGDQNLRLADVLQDKVKLTYIVEEVQQQMINNQISFSKALTSIQQTRNQEPLLLPERRSRTMSEICTIHPDLVEFKDDELVKPGDTFASPDAFLDYTNPRGKKWLFYYCIWDSVRIPSVSRLRTPYVEMRCVFSVKQNLTSRKREGLRKTKQYKTKCPCRVRLKWIPEQKEFKVQHVCNHHDHELSEKMVAKLPPRYRLTLHFKDMKDEIADLHSLDVDAGTIHRYMMDKTGLKFKKQYIDNQIISMIKKNVQVQYSAAKLKTLLVKINEINERFGPKEKTNKETEPPTVSKASSGKPNKAFKELLDHKKRVEDREQAARAKSLENMSKPKRIRNRKKRPPPVTDENEECGIKSTAITSLNNTVETEEYNNKGRLERTLEKISYNSEVIQSVRDLQRSAADEIGGSPWSTRYLTGIDDSEEFSDSLKVYATTDSYDNRHESNQYHNEQPGAEIEIEAGNELNADDNTDNHDTNDQQTDNIQGNDLDEAPTSVVAGINDTLTQDSNTAVQDSNTEVQDSNTALQDSNTEVQDSNTPFEDNETVHKSNNVASIDMNELSVSAKHRIELNSANFLDHYVNYVAEATNEDKETTLFNELVTGILKRESEEFKNKFMECCKIALQKLNNKKFVNKETQVNMNIQDSDAVRHQRYSHVSEELQSHNMDLRRIRTHQSNSNKDFQKEVLNRINNKEIINKHNKEIINKHNKEIINKHNIDTFIVRPDASTLMETLSKKSSLPIMVILKSIYLDKAILVKTTMIKQTTRSPTRLIHTILSYKLTDTENPDLDPEET